MINSPRVCIQVQSVYIEAQSSPDDERYVFAYTVTIRNLGRAPVQLLGRYWLITNGHGRETEVQGRRCGWRPAAHCAWRRVSVHQRRGN
ncbi:CorD protein [Salmonella enterica subsp. enterica]|uniref:CorD protein n=1 Tax=Salmonella enterica I TaxID=59201 RepID=A0A447MY58_SALET|nr:CorD protein [Salmonella enterica subsp. enterica]